MDETKLVEGTMAERGHELARLFAESLAKREDGAMAADDINELQLTEDIQERLDV